MLLASLIAAGLCLSLFFETAISVSRRKTDNGVFTCMYNQLCQCKNEAKWAECWNTLHEVTKTWMVNETHNCENGGNFPSAPFPEIAQHLCGFSESEFKVCYDYMAEILKVYLDEVHESEVPEKKNEGELIEKARLCIGPNIMECSQFGNNC